MQEGHRLRCRRGGEPVGALGRGEIVQGDVLHRKDRPWLARFGEQVANGIRVAAMDEDDCGLGITDDGGDPGLMLRPARLRREDRDGDEAGIEAAEEAGDIVEAGIE